MEGQQLAAPNLLALPEEVQFMIARKVLLGDDDTEPLGALSLDYSLLCVCKKTRRMTLGILENDLTWIDVNIHEMGARYQHRDHLVPKFISCMGFSTKTKKSSAQGKVCPVEGFLPVSAVSFKIVEAYPSAPSYMRCYSRRIPFRRSLFIQFCNLLCLHNHRYGVELRFTPDHRKRREQEKFLRMVSCLLRGLQNVTIRGVFSGNQKEASTKKMLSYETETETALAYHLGKLKYAEDLIREGSDHDVLSLYYNAARLDPTGLIRQPNSLLTGSHTSAELNSIWASYLYWQILCFKIATKMILNSDVVVYQHMVGMLRSVLSLTRDQLSFSPAMVKEELLAMHLCKAELYLALAIQTERCNRRKGDLTEPALGVSQMRRAILMPICIEFDWMNSAVGSGHLKLYLATELELYFAGLLQDLSPAHNQMMRIVQGKVCRQKHKRQVATWITYNPHTGEQHNRDQRSLYCNAWEKMDFWSWVQSRSSRVESLAKYRTTCFKSMADDVLKQFASMDDGSVLVEESALDGQYEQVMLGLPTDATFQNLRFTNMFFEI